jgi:hypothetical protein
MISGLGEQWCKVNSILLSSKFIGNFFLNKKTQRSFAPGSLSPNEATVYAVRAGIEPAPLSVELACLRLPTFITVLPCGVL